LAKHPEQAPEFKREQDRNEYIKLLNEAYKNPKNDDESAAKAAKSAYETYLAQFPPTLQYPLDSKK
jgi:hypothetical protein